MFLVSSSSETISEVWREVKEVMQGRFVKLYAREDIFIHESHDFPNGWAETPLRVHGLENRDYDVGRIVISRVEYGSVLLLA